MRKYIAYFDNKQRKNPKKHILAPPKGLIDYLDALEKLDNLDNLEGLEDRKGGPQNGAANL